MAYPGGYVPLLKEEEVRSVMKHQKKIEGLAPVNLADLTDSYKVEIAIPGIKKENLFVYAQAHTLSVYVLSKERVRHEEATFQQHQFNFDCFEQRIDLPHNADPEFAIAEYRSGILQLYIPKSDYQSTGAHTTIVVY